MKTFIFYCLGLVISCIPVLLNAQDIQPFKDKETKLWGFRDEETGNIIMNARYEKTIEYHDTLGIVTQDGKFGLVGVSGKEIIPCSYNNLYFEKADRANRWKIATAYYNDSIFYLPVYYINTSGKCVPTDYYPCPGNVPMDTSDCSEEVKLIQRGNKALESCELTKATGLYKQAIKANPDNPASYYWYSYIYMEMLCGYITKDTVRAHMTEIDEYLKKAYNTETNEVPKAKIGTERYRLYSGYISNKKEKKTIAGDMMGMGATVSKFGLYVQGGVQYLNQEPGVEFGIFFGDKDYGEKGFLGRKQAGTSLDFGITYEHRINENVGCFKLMLLNVQSPITIGYYPVIYTDFNKWAIGFRPEGGFSYRKFSVAYGYNWISKKNFPEYRGHFFALRYHFFAGGRKSYFYDEITEEAEN
jgi:hypothetical protein